MTKRFVLGYILCCLAALPLGAQVDFNRFQPLESEGRLPPDVLSVLHMNPDRAGTFGYREEYILYREEKVNYLRHVQYAIYELFQQGLILFNDTATRYVNRVAHRIIQHNHTLQSEMRFYLVKSPAINAFVTENGMAFVTLGLVARCRSEAQLAWVLSRLVAHYIQQHRLSGHEIFLMVTEQLEGYVYPGLEDRLLGRRLYGAADQMYADTAALRNFVRAGYAAQEALAGVKVISNAYAPWEDIYFSTVFFENEYLRIPPEYLALELGELQADPQQKQHLARYVPPAQRRGILQAAADRYPSSGSAFVGDRADFDYVAKLARYELCLLYLAHHRYEHAFYQAYLLELEDFNNPFLERMLVSAFYGMAARAQADTLHPRELHSPDYQHLGQVAQLYHLAAQMPAQELICVALHTALRYQTQQPFSRKVQAIGQDLAQLLRTHYRWNADWLRIALLRGPEAANQSLPEGDTLLPTYTPLCLQALKAYQSSEQLYHLFMPEDETSQQFGRFKRIAYGLELAVPPPPPGHARVQDVQLARASYLLADLRRTDKLMLNKTLQGQFWLNVFLRQQLDSLTLPVSLLDGSSLERDSMHMYNQMQRMHLWLNERQFAPPGTRSLVSEYAPQSRVIASCKVLAARQARKKWPWVLSASVLVPPLLPAGIYYVATPATDQVLSFTLYDTGVGKQLHTYSRSMRAPHWRRDLMQNQLYHALLRLPYHTFPLEPKP